jgi:hypothetical protein
MAIRKTLSLANAASENVNVACYIRVVGINISKDQSVATYHVCRNDSMKVIYQRTIPFAPDVNGNTWAQAYVALKKTDEFADAADC